MSPRIGMGLGLWPFAEAASAMRPLDRARAAVLVVEAQGIRVAVGEEHNVGKHEVTHGWVIDRPQLRTVSLVGAICLALQPVDGDEVEDGAAAALECSVDWLAGLRDGWESDAQTTLLTGASRELYLDGVRAGHLLFGEMTVECRECGERRYVRVESCLACGVAV